jgi:hypothetical protein
VGTSILLALVERSDFGTLDRIAKARGETDGSVDRRGDRVLSIRLRRRPERKS